MSYLLICRSLTFAQRTLKRIEKAGIAGSIVKAPQALLEEGCGYSVRVAETRYRRAMEALKGSELMPKRVFLQYADGHYAEVKG